jgi:hypothetical protein
MCRVFQFATAMASSTLPTPAMKSVANVLRVWWKTNPPALRPAGKLAFVQALRHALRKSPTHP